MIRTNAGAVTIIDWALTADADAGDFDLDSLDRLEFFDAGLFIDGGTNAVMLISTDGTLEIATNDWDISTTGVQTNMGDITSEGTIQAEQLTSTDDALIKDALTLGDDANNTSGTFSHKNSSGRV